MKKKLSLTGLIDLDASTIEVGRLLAADYLAIGTLSSYDQEILTFESYGATTEKLTASITGDIRLANTTTGVVERAASFAVSHEEVLLGMKTPNQAQILRTLLEKAFQNALPELLKAEAQKEAEEPELTEVFAYVDSKPTGAEVYLDRRYRGVTPLTLNMTPGSHRIEIRAEGYAPWSNEIIAFDGLRVNAVLNPRNN